MSTTRQHLDRLALAAHARGDTWSAFWPNVAEQVRQAEPHDRRRYHRLVRRLLALLTAGDTAGMKPLPDPWERDNFLEPAGTGETTR